LIFTGWPWSASIFQRRMSINIVTGLPFAQDNKPPNGSCIDQTMFPQNAPAHRKAQEPVYERQSATFRSQGEVQGWWPCGSRIPIQEKRSDVLVFGLTYSLLGLLSANKFNIVCTPYAPNDWMILHWHSCFTVHSIPTSYAPAGTYLHKLEAGIWPFRHTSSSRRYYKNYFSACASRDVEFCRRQIGFYFYPARTSLSSWLGRCFSFPML